MYLFNCNIYHVGHFFSIVNGTYRQAKGEATRVQATIAMVVGNVSLDLRRESPRLFFITERSELCLALQHEGMCFFVATCVTTNIVATYCF